MFSVIVCCRHGAKSDVARKPQNQTNKKPTRGGGGRHKSGAWDKHTHTTIYKIDNQQGPAV